MTRKSSALIFDVTVVNAVVRSHDSCPVGTKGRVFSGGGRESEEGKLSRKTLPPCIRTHAGGILLLSRMFFTSEKD